MKLFLYGHSFHYEMENLCRLFFHRQKIEVFEDCREFDGPDAALTLVERKGETLCLLVKTAVGTYRGEGRDTVSAEAPPQEAERRLAVLLFRQLTEACGIRPRWGILTGVRPVKFFRSLVEKHGEEEAARIFREDYLVTEEKLELSRVTMRNEGALLARSRPDSCSLYVSIPFCPTRCAYCSFVSSTVEKTVKLIPDYVELLCRELEKTAEVVRDCGLRVESVYFGGGTPTAISAEQLALLLDTVNRHFDLSHSREFTVEAGRPDSITGEKLAALREYPVSRISINPQTMQQKTLDLVGRRHTVQQTVEAFYAARAMGFDNINMDLIAGLPEETAADMRDTLARIEELRPDSLTVHALAIKRAARMGQEGRTAQLHAEITRMVDDAAKSAAGMGLEPYYLYRQKNIAGNFENVGYAEVDKAGIYNILIMEEKQTILAAGAGASTKILLQNPIIKDGGKEVNLVRAENVKSINDYIARIDEMIERKGEWLWR